MIKERKLEEKMENSERNPCEHTLRKKTKKRPWDTEGKCPMVDGGGGRDEKELLTGWKLNE